MRPRRWEEREPDLAGVIDEVRRLFRRARRRKLLVAFLTVVSVALLTVREYRKQRSYPATVVLSATEAENASVEFSHTNARLQDYVWYAVYTDATLFSLMEKHKFRPDLMKKNPRQALESFREDLDVDVYKNEFTHERYPGSPPRSARIAIEMRAPDPDAAVALARDLGDLVVKRDAETRKERYEMERRVATEAISLAETEISRLRREQLRAEAQFESASIARLAELRVTVEYLDRAIMAAETRLKEAEKARQRLDVESSADKSSLTLRYERVDWGAPKTRVNTRMIVIRTVVFGLLLLFPLLALIVGAFDPRVYDEKDISRLGLKPLGLIRKTAMGQR